MDGGGFNRRSGVSPGVALADPANQVSLPSGPRSSLAYAKRDKPATDEEKIAAFIEARGVTKCPTAYADASDGYVTVVEAKEIHEHRFRYKGKGGRGKAGKGALMRYRARFKSRAK